MRFMGLEATTKSLLELAMILFMVETEMIIFSLVRVMTPYMAKEAMIQFIYRQVQEQEGGSCVTPEVGL